jgi:hypothetical protein
MADTVIDSDVRIERLSRASLRRVIEPDTEFTGALGGGQVVPDELLTVAGLGLGLTAERRVVLAREELASVLRFGIIFECVLMSGFSLQMALASDVADPRFVYALHEIGEETRHSRMFIRLVEQLAPTQKNPFTGRRAARMRGRVLPALLRRPATLDVLVLAGEEIPDLYQKLLSDHPDTDPLVRDVSRYHRAEEARHLAFARTTVGEHYRDTTWTDRVGVRRVAPLVIAGMFDFMVQPYAYAAIGLPAWRTWLRVRREPGRIALRTKSARAVLRALLDAEVLKPGRIPRGWRRLADVDRRGAPLPTS